MKKILLLIVGLLFSAGIATSKTLSVEDYGLKPDSRINAVPIIQKIIADAAKSGGATIVFPKGRYDFWPQHSAQKNYHQSNTSDIFPQNVAILLEKVGIITFDGQGSMFVMHDRIIPFAIDNSSKITLKNISVDWDIPLTADGEIVEVTPTYFEVKINRYESPFVIENKKLVFVGEGWKSRMWSAMEFRAEPRIIEYQTGDTFSWSYRNYDVEATADPDVVRFLAGDQKKPVKGNWFVLRHSERDHSGVFVQGSKDIVFENFVLHHTAGLGILCQYTENITFLNSGVYPNAEKKRFLSGHDDGFHLMGCKGKIVVDGCRWEGLMDDPINIHGTCVRIVEVLAPNRIKCQFMHEQSQGMEWGQAGNKVGFIENNSMRTVATGTMTGFKKLSTSDFEVELSAPIPEGITVGAALENLTWIPDVEIRNSFFGGCRARGLLLSVPGKIVVENNIFVSSGSAILIAGDANQWYESGAVKDVLIKGNEFRSPCMTSMYQFCEAIISIEPEIPKPEAKYPFHSNIRIIGNVFHPFDYPILYAKSVDGLTFSDNTIIRSNDFKPFHPRKDGITLRSCRAVVIENNKIEGDVLGKTIKLEETARKDVKVGNKEFFIFAK